jgi:hypothetical protein
LNVEIIEIHHCKNKCYWWFRRLHVRTGKVSKKHQKWDQYPSPNRWKIDTKIMLEKGVAKRWPVIKQVIRKGGDKWEKIRMKNMRTKRYLKKWKKRDGARSGTLPQGAENTIRSKIEDKLTEEKLNDRESAA